MTFSLEIVETILKDLKDFPLDKREISLKSKSRECGDDWFNYKEYTISHPALNYNIVVCYGDYTFFHILPCSIENILDYNHKKILEQAFRLQYPVAIYNNREYEKSVIEAKTSLLRNNVSDETVEAV